MGTHLFGSPCIKKKLWLGYQFDKDKTHFSEIIFEFFCKFHPATKCFTVPMMPSQEDFPQVFAKNDQD